MDAKRKREERKEIQLLNHIVGKGAAHPNICSFGIQVELKVQSTETLNAAIQTI
jgi:hypothetical protein